MRRSILLMLAIVCLSFLQPVLLEAASPGSAQPDLLQQPITVNYQNVTLPYILRDLHERYQIKFAYLNNEISEDQTFSLQANRQPLGGVLEELLKDTGLSYQVVNGQVVLTKNTGLSNPLAPSDSSTQSTKAQEKVRKVPDSPSSLPAKPKNVRTVSSELLPNVVVTKHPEETVENTSVLPDQLEG